MTKEYPRITENILALSSRFLRFCSTVFACSSAQPEHKNNGKKDYVKCMKEMAGIQWERRALHIWQEKWREAVAL